MRHYTQEGHIDPAWLAKNPPI
eukprot:COSAG02_NODE_23557_length_715_cov_0.954545_2_plen_21_part_01